MKIAHRKTLLAGLVAAFVGQTALVYTDPTAEETPPLIGLELEGRKLWLDHNCQACHQFYGFGGFLGPDLTNAASRLNRERLDTVLTVGSGQMPAWGFSKEQIDAIEAYLRAVDRTGIGVARSSVPHASAEVTAAVAAQAADTPLSESAQRGRERFRTACVACHRLFAPTPLGAFLAPDLTDARSRLTDEELHQVLVEGRPDRGMPAWQLGEAERGEVIDWLDWLAANRAALLERLNRARPETEQGLPWFEFK